MELHEQMKETEVTKTSEELREFSLVIEGVKYGRKSVDELDSIVVTVEGWLRDGELNTFDRLMSYYILGHAYNAKKCLTVDPSQAMFNNPLVLKEVFCHRKTLNIVEEIKTKGIIMLYNTALGCEYQAHVHLGNVYDHLGRHMDALHSYAIAGKLMPNDYMWKFNLGFSYGGMFGYYEERVQPYVVALAKELLKPFLNMQETTRSAIDMYKMVNGLKTPANLKDINYEYGESEEDDYNRWVNENYLRLNAYNDVNPYSGKAQDDSLYFDSIYSTKDNSDKCYRLMTMLNEIKQEYVTARFMLYSYFRESGKSHFSDKHVRIADVLQYANYSYNVELAKSAFRALYSLLDKIAFALNDYLELGMKGKNVDFKNFWYADRKTRNIRQKILNHSTIISLAGLLFIRNDVYGGSESYLQADETKHLQMVRNAMEHRVIQIVDEGAVEDKDAMLIISRGDFERVAMNLISTVRQAIFCFVNAVKHIEYDKITEARKKGIVLSQFVDDISDEEKI